MEKTFYEFAFQFLIYWFVQKQHHKKSMKCINSIKVTPYYVIFGWDEPLE